MPNSTPDDDALIRSIGRIAVIRAQLARRTWPLLADLSQADRDVFLDATALRDYRSECHVVFVERS